MSDKKIAIMCGGPFAFPSLMKLSMERYLCGVVLASKQHAIVANIRNESERSNYPFLHIESKNAVDLLDEWIDTVKPDAIFSVCFPYKIPKAILNKIPNGFYNFHPGPLPNYRGPSPIFEVLKRSEKESAICVHTMSSEYDEGNIVFTEKVTLASDENYQTLALKLSSRCGIAVLNLAEMIAFSSTPVLGTKQNESLAAFYPFPSERDMTVDWNNMDAENILALINACHSWTRGAITWLFDEMIRIPNAIIVENHTALSFVPGTVTEISEDGTCVISCRNNKLIRIPQFSSDYGDLGHDYLKSLGLLPGIRLSINCEEKTIK